MAELGFSENPAVVLKGMQTLFGDVHERKVVFCIDTSGSMFELLPSVQENLIETLLKMAYREGRSEFNLISFNSAVEQWSDCLVKCNPGTVGFATKWIERLEPTSGTNTLDALLCAFKNNPDAVYLVTDGMPDQESDAILDHIAYIGKGRPVHCLLIFKGTPNKDACDFLKQLAKETFGSFSMVAFARHGCIERITPVHGGVRYSEQIIRTNDGSIYPNLSNCSVTTRLHGDPLQDPVFTAPGTVVNPESGVIHPYYHPHNHWYWWGLPVPGAYGPYMYNPYYSWSRYRASRAFINANEKLADASDDSQLCPTSSVLLIGRQVLARRRNDGFYYKGTVKSQVTRFDEKYFKTVTETQTHRYVIEFGPVQDKKESVMQFEDVHVSNLIGFDDAFRHPLLPGDRCLVPVKPLVLLRYQPATVMEGSERRAGKVPEDTDPLVVALYNGTLTSIPAGSALWIPNPMFHRLALESKMPRKAREKLASVPGYPLVSQPGYPVDADSRFPKDYTKLKPKSEEGRALFVDHLLPPYYLPVHPSFDVNDKKIRSQIVQAAGGRILDPTKKKNERDYEIEALHAKVLEQINMHNESNTNNAVEEDKETKKEEEESKEMKMVESKEKEEEEEVEEEEEDGGSPTSDYEDSGYGGTKSAKPLTGKRRPPWRNFSKGSIPALMGAPEREPYAGATSSNKEMQYDRFELLSELSGTSPPLHSRSRVAWQSSGPLGDVSGQVGRHELDRERRDVERAQFQRDRVLRREEQRQSRLAAEAATAVAAEAGARQRRSAHLERLQARQAKDAEQLEKTEKHRKATLEAIRVRHEKLEQESQKEQAERDVRRVEIMRQRREERENFQRDRAEKMEEHRKKLEQMRFQKDDARWRELHNRMAAEEAACRRQDLVARGVERQRMAELRRLEERQQRLRDLEAFSRRQNEPPLA